MLDQETATGSFARFVLHLVVARLLVMVGFETLGYNLGIVAILAFVYARCCDVNRLINTNIALTAALAETSRLHAPKNIADEDQPRSAAA